MNSDPRQAMIPWLLCAEFEIDHAFTALQSMKTTTIDPVLLDEHMRGLEQVCHTLLNTQGEGERPTMMETTTKKVPFANAFVRALPFGYRGGALASFAQQAGVYPEILQKMILRQPVPHADAVKVLATVSAQPSHDGHQRVPYTLDNTEVVLLDEPGDPQDTTRR